MKARNPRYSQFAPAAAALVLIVAQAGARAATTPAISAFDDAFAKVNDYTVTMTAHEVSGNDTQDRVYHYWFKKPADAKIEVVSGPGRGSGGVWTGGDRVSGHQGGLLSHFHMKVDLHDGRAVSLRGYTIPDGLFSNEVARYRDSKGELSEHDGPTIDGEATDAVELKPADPKTLGGITRMVLYLSKSTHMPIKQMRYQGDQLVADETWTELKTNVGLTDSDFPF
jgi:outer membrane lipoprotein-sorting protein